MASLDTRFAAQMARLAQAAYIDFASDGGAELKAQLARMGLTLVATFDWDAPEHGAKLRERRDRGSQAYLASGPDKVLLIFRGSSEKSDWATNLQVGKRRVEVGDRVVFLHAGFALSYRQIEKRLLAEVDAEMARQSRPLYIVGHSLGGALAQIATAMSTRPELTACYSFGAPRVAASWFRRTLTVPHYRIVNGWDVVPTVPPALIGYGHTGPSWHLKRDPPNTVLGRGRSPLRTVWINVRSLFGMAFGRSWAGVRDHEIGRYAERLETLAKKPA
jgi:hypothetical protein